MEEEQRRKLSLVMEGIFLMVNVGIGLAISILAGIGTYFLSMDTYGDIYRALLGCSTISALTLLIITIVALSNYDNERKLDKLTSILQRKKQYGRRKTRRTNR